MDEMEREEQAPRKRGFLKWLLFLLILVAVLAVAVLAAYRDGTGFDALRRYFAYGKSSGGEGKGVISYDASSNNRFAVLGSSLVVLSDTELQVLDGSGTVTESVSVAMSAPAISVGSSCAVAYDVGGRELYVVDAKGVRLHLTAEEDEPFIAATLNGKDWLAVVSEKKKYKGSVSVYNDQMNEVFDFDSSERFVTDAYVSDDCRSMAAVTLGQESSVFVSNVVIYALDAQEPKANYSVQNGLEVAIRQIGDALVTVSDTCLTAGSFSGNVTQTYSYAGEYLREYSLDGDGYAVLLLNRYQSGSVGRLVTVDAKGEQMAQLDVQSEILSVSAAGRYIAVLYADRLAIYNPDLKEYASLTGTEFAKDVLMRTDGSALLVSSENARVFVP